MTLEANFRVVAQWLFTAVPFAMTAQSARWQLVIRREPRVRHLLADMPGGDKSKVVKEISNVGAAFPNWSPDGKQHRKT